LKEQPHLNRFNCSGIVSVTGADVKGRAVHGNLRNPFPRGNIKGLPIQVALIGEVDYVLEYG
jgi:hypothetical protein